MTAAILNSWKVVLCVSSDRCLANVYYAKPNVMQMCALARIAK